MNIVARLRFAFSRALAALYSAWLEGYQPLDSPDPDSPAAKAAALREGALLTEEIEARSGKRAA